MIVSLTMIKKSNLPSMLDVFIEHRKVNTTLFDRVNLILEAVDIETELKKYYNKGQSIVPITFNIPFLETGVWAKLH